MHPLGPILGALATPECFPRKISEAVLAHHLQKGAALAEYFPDKSAIVIDGMSLLQNVGQNDGKFGDIAAVVLSIGLYRDVWIAAIASSTTSLATRTAAICVLFQGRRVRRAYVTMQITFLTRKSALIYRRGLRQRVASLTLNCNGVFAIRAYGAQRRNKQFAN